MIVIFGGAFNPPTKAHLDIYHHVMGHLNCDLFIYLPTSSLYTKRSLASNHHRYQMLKILTADLPLAEVSTMELNDSDYRGTYQSLLRFQERYPDQELVFLIGADNLFKLHKWINAPSLLADFRFVLLDRNGIDIRELFENDPFLSEHLQQFIFLPGFTSEASSTAYRESFNDAYVIPSVADYIRLHGLYRG